MTKLRLGPVARMRPLFSRLFSRNLSLGASATYTRSTTATVTDWEGLVKPAISGEARFEGARRVRNLLGAAGVGSGDLSTSWTVSSMTVGAGVSDPDGGSSAYTLTSTGTNGYWKAELSGYTAASSFRSTIWIRRRTGTGAVYLYRPNQGTMTISSLSASWQRITNDVLTGHTNTQRFGIVIATSGDAVDVWHPQLENVTGQSNQNPSEYVSVGVLSAPYHGANVDGVKYFATQNGNTVSSSVVTEATGAALTTVKGLLMEPATSNLCLYSEDLSNAAWVATDITKGSTAQTVPDGTSNAVCELTASGANGTLLQSITSASATRLFSVWLKRKTGTGDIDLTVDGGTTWTTKSITTSWARYDITQAAVTNPVIGVRIVTSADAIYMWGAQLTSQAVVTSYIPTTTAAVTRNADTLSYPLTTPQTAGMAIVGWRAGCTSADLVANNFASGLLSFRSSSSTSVVYFVSNGATLRTYDGTSTLNTDAYSFAAYDALKTAAAWTAGGTMYIGSYDSGVWDFNSTGMDANGYDVTDNVLNVGYARQFPLYVESIYIYNANKGQTWIGANF